MLWGFAFAGFFGYVVGHQVGQARNRERLAHAEQLVQTLKAFVSVAKTDGRRSAAVDFADQELTAYEKKWIK